MRKVPGDERKTDSTQGVPFVPGRRFNLLIRQPSRQKIFKEAWERNRGAKVVQSGVVHVANMDLDKLGAECRTASGQRTSQTSESRVKHTFLKLQIW